ncbi:M15 family metallopeptidase [Fructobacillus sp. M1-13]|uniref:M15 family metallopeptidase n=1 Tax=Fructobacillus papyriferae TaxID=2713171 RepID=A0ABS5QRW1_9LACO|nr:M15 family metallopeptidase [Fructobacillus papyriferae]MBS9335210.1 M15 family metallopeptidase [Fructobacillus papyriferae]MCD2159121.1 M15 family metallopeptidase [Fructobacillus papyriferae]
MSKKKFLAILLSLVVLAAVVSAGVYWQTGRSTEQERSQKSDSSKSDQSVRLTNLPKGVKSTDWDLILVNKWHKKDSEINFDKATVSGVTVDQRIKQAVLDFQSGARAAGYQTNLISGYRSIQYQKEVFAGVKKNNLAEGMNDAAAEKATAAVVQYPGSSEHQTGLAIDMAGSDAFERYPSLEANMDQFDSQKWLIDHAADYGFVLRYPKEKEQMKQTGIDYESWHFRYVGVANAKYMKAHNLTLEAYVKGLQEAGR